MKKIICACFFGAVLAMTVAVTPADASQPTNYVDSQNAAYRAGLTNTTSGTPVVNSGTSAVNSGSGVPASLQPNGTGQQTYQNSMFGNSPTYANSGYTGGGTSGGSSSASVGSCSTLTQNGLNGIVNCILGVLDNVITLLMAGAVVYIVWGAFQMLSSEEKRAAGKDTIVYGIIGLFVMVSIWGLVNILDRTFNLQGSYIAPVKLHQP